MKSTIAIMLCSFVICSCTSNNQESISDTFEGDTLNTISLIEKIIQTASKETGTTNLTLLDYICFSCVKDQESGYGVLNFEYPDGINGKPSYSYFSFEQCSKDILQVVDEDSYIGLTKDIVAYIHKTLSSEDTPVSRVQGVALGWFTTSKEVFFKGETRLDDNGNVITNIWGSL